MIVGRVVNNYTADVFVYFNYCILVFQHRNVKIVNIAEHSVNDFLAVLMSVEEKLYVLLFADVCYFSKTAFGENGSAHVLGDSKVAEKHDVLCSAGLGLLYASVNKIDGFFRKLSVRTVGVVVARNVKVYKGITAVGREKGYVRNLFALAVFGVPQLILEKTKLGDWVVVSF